MIFFLICFSEQNMKQNMEQAFINTVIAFKIMQYAYSLQCFFKEEFKKKMDILYRFRTFYM